LFHYQIFTIVNRIFTSFTFIILIIPFLAAQNFDTSQIHLEGHESSYLKAGACPAGSLLSNPSNGGWALTSSTDQGTVNYLRFDATMLHESTEVDGFILWGLQAFNDGEWSQCLSDEMDFAVMFYEDNNGEPGDIIFEDVITGTAVADPNVGFGTWTVKKFTITLSESVPFYDGFVTIASTNSPTCWFLGINAEDTDLNNSYVYDEDGNFVLRTVVPEGDDPYVTGLGFCLLGTDESTTVVDIIVESPDHSTLATAVTAAGLVDALSARGPFTVFAPTDDAFEALPDGILEDLLADPDRDLTKVLLYHVVEGNVLSGDLSDGQVITTLLGQELTVTIAGEDVFINDFDGNTAQVTGPDLEADNGVVHVIDAVLVPDLTASIYDVTFVVDMTLALNDGFDPAVHKVFMTGDFLGWATPGEEGWVELSMVVDTKEEELLYPGNWLNSNDIIYGVWADDEQTIEGPIFGTNLYGDNAYGQIFEIDQEYTFSGAKYIIGERIGETGSAAFTIWDYSGGSVGDVIASKVIDMADITAGTGMDDAFVVLFDGPITVTDDFIIGVDLTGLNDWDDGSYELGNMHSDFDEGAGGGLALILEDSDWIPVLGYGVDVDIAVFPIISTVPYSVTLEIEEGAIQYKYFSDAFGDGWAGAEWDGDPNRVINIAGDMTVNDIFGDKPVSVVENELAEQGINLFPNPVRNKLYVENSAQIKEVRIFDLTGRLVMSQVVNNNTATVSVSEFKTGVYIMQVMTVNGVASKKFIVR